MKKTISKLLLVLLMVFMLPGCAALQALEDIWGPKEPEDGSVQETDQTQSPSDSTAPSSAKPAESTKQQPQADPLDFADEQALRAAMEGEWVYCPPMSDQPAVWITFSADGNFQIRARNPENGVMWEGEGFCYLEYWEDGGQAVPDMMRLTLSQEAADQSSRPVSNVGDFLIAQKTLCEGEIVLGLLQLNNGDSLFSAYDYDMFPILKKYTGWQPQEAGRKAEIFCAAVYKVDEASQTVWLDDTTQDGENIGRYEALPYQMAPGRTLNSLPDWPWLVADGSIWMAQTDEMGRLIDLRIYLYDSEFTEPGGLTEEEAAMILVEAYEIQGYLQQGMRMFFEGETEVIGGETCILISLGTNDEDHFVREIYYAVAPSGSIYTYDVGTDTWNAVT